MIDEYIQEIHHALNQELDELDIALTNDSCNSLRDMHEKVKLYYYVLHNQITENH